MHRLLLPLLVCMNAACTQSPQQARVVGHFDNPAIDEASGLAYSRLEADLFWVMNDDGPPRIYAVDSSGADRGRIKLAGASNVDWEDLASFELHGKPYLLVADTGDNNSRRDTVTLYVLEEPDLRRNNRPKVSLAWRIDFSYPDGPRDVESVAVDVDNERILLLSKREIPAVLYELPLLPDSNAALVARRLGPIDSIPQPSEREANIAAQTNNWYWQPTGFDISADGMAAVILSYEAVHYFERDESEDWLNAFATIHTSVDISQYRDAEAVAFAASKHSIYITVEAEHAPLLHIDLAAPK